MYPTEFQSRVLDPAMAQYCALLRISNPHLFGPEARVLLLAIAGQESSWTSRTQLASGPARGFWQFESGGGVAGVLRHTATRYAALALCEALEIPPTQQVIHEALAWNDTLALGFARLLLWSDPHALPRVGDQASAWDLYLRTWRPGKPHPQVWPQVYAQALGLVQPSLVPVGP